MKNGGLTLLVGYVLIVLEAYFAFKDNFLTVPQMFLLREIKHGIPLLGHCGFLSDGIIITPMLAILAAKYGDRWSKNDILSSFIIALVITVVMVTIWTRGTKDGLPEAMAYDGKLLSAGFFHAVYMVGAITILLLSFFHSDITRTAAAIVSLILAVHIVVGSHVLLGLIAPSWFPVRPHKQIFTWVVILSVWALLFWRCLTLK